MLQPVSMLLLGLIVLLQQVRFLILHDKNYLESALRQIFRFELPVENKALFCSASLHFRRGGEESSEGDSHWHCSITSHLFCRLLRCICRPHVDDAVLHAG